MYNTKNLPVLPNNYTRIFFLTRYLRINKKHFCDKSDDKDKRSNESDESEQTNRTSKSTYKEPKPTVDHTTGTGLGTLKNPEGLMSDLGSSRETEYFYKQNREAMKNLRRRQKLKMLEEELKRLQKEQEYGKSGDGNEDK